MPNLDTHAGLALRAFPEGGIESAAGEVFDDAVRMAGGVPNPAAPISFFKLGIVRNNVITDAAFDAQPVLIQAIRDMTADMKERGMGVRLQNKCVEIGTDMLFSGVSYERSFDREAYQEACDFLLSNQGADLIRMNAMINRQKCVSLPVICELIGHIVSHGPRPQYSDPDFVVNRLKLRLATTRLKIPDDDPMLHAGLVEVFAAQQVRLVKVADDIYEGTVDAIKADTRLRSLSEITII